jgi:hypothetical protein
MIKVSLLKALLGSKIELECFDGHLQCRKKRSSIPNIQNWFFLFIDIIIEIQSQLYRAH